MAKVNYISTLKCTNQCDLYAKPNRYIDLNTHFRLTLRRPWSDEVSAHDHQVAHTACRANNSLCMLYSKTHSQLTNGLLSNCRFMSKHVNFLCILDLACLPVLPFYIECLDELRRTGPGAKCFPMVVPSIRPQLVSFSHQKSSTIPGQHPWPAPLSLATLPGQLPPPPDLPGQLLSLLATNCDHPGSPPRPSLPRHGRLILLSKEHHLHSFRHCGWRLGDGGDHPPGDPTHPPGANTGNLEDRVQVPAINDNKKQASLDPQPSPDQHRSPGRRLLRGAVDHPSDNDTTTSDHKPNNEPDNKPNSVRNIRRKTGQTRSPVTGGINKFGHL